MGLVPIRATCTKCGETHDDKLGRADSMMYDAYLTFHKDCGYVEQTVVWRGREEY